MPKGSRKEREIEQLRRRRQKAQDNGDIAEEAKICNAIGELFSQSGEWRRALQYHRVELSLSEGGGDQLGAAIAHRRIGECECELGNYSSAIQHQTQHLTVSQKLGNLVEEQRALATLGRTYFVQSQSEEEEEGERETLIRAGNAFLKSLDVCDKLVDRVPERELLEMRSRLYLNLGLVYEDRKDFVSARKFMEKALNTVKELGDSATVFRCHFDLGSLHLQEHHPTLALHCFQEALATAKHQGSAQNEAEALREIGQAHLLLCNFQAAKSCLKKVLLFAESSQGDTEHVARQLRVVRKILHYSREVEGVGVGSVGERLRLYDKLGDLCCSVKAFPAAVRFYGQQLSLAEAHGLEPRDLSPIYVSLARTHSDCRQFSQALLYFEKELELWRGNPSEECDTWVSIARVRESAGEDSEAVMEAYGRAVGLAEQGGNPKQKVAVHKAVVKFCQGRPGLVASCAHWEGELSRLLRAHPEVDTSTSESESEPLNEDSDPPPSLPSSDLDEEKEEEEESEDTPLPQTARQHTVRKKSRILRRNEKGETMLHIAAIEGNLAAARQLIREGIEVNVRDNCGWIPLHEACNHGHLDVVRCLIEAGGAVNDRGGAHCGGVTPLIDAAANGHLEVVQLLVQRGADVGARDVEGRTALSILEEQLSSVAESGQRYELLEEHKAIARFLRAEMRRRGVAEGPGERGRRELGGGRRIRMHDRTGQGVLYDNNDETSADTTVQALQGSSTSNSGNPFQSFTVVSTPHGDQELNRSSTTERKKKPPRGFFNPLGQVELPALIPEGEEEEEGGDFPVVDDWLVDDMGQPPSKRTKRNEFCEPGSSVVKGTQQTSGRRERQRRGRKRGGGIGRQGGSTSVGSGRGRAIEIGSDSESSPASEVDMGDDDWSAVFDDDNPPNVIDSVLFGNTVAASSSRTHTQTVSTQLPQTTAMTEAPLRVRVRIEDKCYVIPCPRKLEDSDTTIGWLASQASERYYSHHSVRPQLSLTTSDGALLCTTDPIAHVLQHNEEVVGVAEHWHLPPLGERYQAACRNAGVACHRRVLRLFQSHGSAPSLDLSHLALRESHAPPLLHSLQGQHTLTSLSLAGNRLGDSPMPLLTSSLACLSSLHLLDLTCTGISTQGLESLVPSSPSSWSGLRRLVLSHNDLGPTAGRALARLLSLCSGLRELLLDCCGLTSAVLDQHTGLGEALHALTGLTELSLSHNLLNDDGVSRLLSSLPTARLTRLELAATCTHCPLTPVLPSVAEFFRKAGAFLERLDLSHCGLAGGRGELGESLQHCRRLRELRLAGNDLGKNEGGVEELCRCVASSTTLTLLDVGGNSHLGNAGCLRILEVSGGLSQLNLSACGLKSPLPEEMMELVSQLRPRLRVFFLSNEIDRTDQLVMTSESL